jgi:hypothetical protein
VQLSRSGARDSLATACSVCLEADVRNWPVRLKRSREPDELNAMPIYRERGKAVPLSAENRNSVFGLFLAALLLPSCTGQPNDVFLVTSDTVPVFTTKQESLTSAVSNPLAMLEPDARVRNPLGQQISFSLCRCLSLAATSRFCARRLPR